MQVSIDEAFLDISPTRHNRTHPVVVAKRIQTRVDELGITCSIGLGTSKSIAKIASDMEKPHGVTVVWPGNERAFLSPLPVKLMSGIGPVAQQKLTHYGIRTLGELVAASDDILRPIFGKSTVKMRERAQGIDSAVNDEAEPVKSVSNEISMAENVSTREDVEALIATMAHKVGRRLRRKQLEGTVLHLKVRFANLKIRTCQRQIPDLGTNELTWLPELNSMLDEIWSEGQELRLVGVGVSGFAGEQPVQETLFDVPRNQYEGKSALTRNAKNKAALLDASDAIAKRFGESAVRFGHELRTYGGTTGSAAKNPEDYKG
jgi:DNA polymerase-4